jgi:hypothetical protein
VNVEGVGAAISPEFVQATATGFLCLALAIAVRSWLNGLWRRWMWRAGVADLAHGLGADVQARPAFGVGLRGPWTRVDRAGGAPSVWHEGLLDRAAIDALVDVAPVEPPPSAAAR